MADSNDIEQFRHDVDAVEKKMAGEIDPGIRTVVVAVLVLILAGSFALPHTGAAKGFDVLFGNDTALAESIALPSRVFVWLALVFGVVISGAALLTRRWALAWLAVAGSAVATVFGMLSIWSRQTLAPGVPGGGVGIGLIVAWIAVGALTFHWLHVVWQRSNVLLAAEEARRNASRDRHDNGPIPPRP